MAQINRNVLTVAGVGAAVALIVAGAVWFTSGADDGDAGAPETARSAAPQTPAQSTPAARGISTSLPGDVPPLPAGMTEMAMGDPDAPVTMVEFASMTCSHCRAFHMDTLPALKERYIDTGKLRYILRDFPLDGLALRASMAARCAGSDRYFAYVDTVFERQPQWAYAEEPLAALGQIFKLGGMSQAAFDACMENKELGENIVAALQAAADALQINATPSFVINGESMSGNQPVDRFAAVIDAALEDEGAQ